jgi:hypothetical protein
MGTATFGRVLCRVMQQCRVYCWCNNLTPWCTHPGEVAYLLIVAIVHHWSIVAEQVEGILEGEYFHRQLRAIQDSPGLCLELVHGCLPSTRSCLVCRHYHPLHSLRTMDGCHCHEGDDCGAVGVGNNASLPCLHTVCSLTTVHCIECNACWSKE